MAIVSYIKFISWMACWLKKVKQMIVQIRNTLDKYHLSILQTKQRETKYTNDEV